MKVLYLICLIFSNHCCKLDIKRYKNETIIITSETKIYNDNDVIKYFIGLRLDERVDITKHLTSVTSPILGM